MSTVKLLINIWWQKKKWYFKNIYPAEKFPTLKINKAYAQIVNTVTSESKQVKK